MFKKISQHFTRLGIAAAFLNSISVYANSEGGHGLSFLSALPLPQHISALLIVGLLLIALTYFASLQLGRAMKTSSGGVIPENRLSFFNFFDIVSEALFNFCVSVLGEKEAKRHYAFIGSIFLIIFASNLLGLIPGFYGPTLDLNTTLAFGFFVFLYYNFMGVREHGLAYLKHFLGPVWWLAWLMVVIELVSHLVRPLSLGLRLRGNIYGDHLVLGMMSDLSHGVLIPVIFYGLGLFVSFIQAFVFTLLTMIYISLSTAHDH